ncbi:hypothetical protein NI389_17625 (plasmid) [Pseudoalteromonas xiamenensis]|uniref:DUF4785 domain-containing protein n=1 Tax=Pseudoalteromonas xiamenensis TaxID=882626 RepID=UPI0027E3CC86|nr:DUF4785 domain-containing protein [Pseudoalteromonas xiamenensis]WMN61635.1 hypothetical protein NI389_17625 [Pseudoalteromonas xiamenensis]
MKIKKLLQALPVFGALTSIGVLANNGYVNFPYPTVISANPSTHTQTLSSTEYWEVVRGDELKKGVPISFTSNKSVVLLSPQHSRDMSRLKRAPAVEENAIELRTLQGKATLSATYNRDEMSGYGFAPGSAAVQANKLAGQNATLRLNQKISDDDLYLLHVKESDSPYQLNVESDVLVGEEAQLALRADVTGVKNIKSKLTIQVNAPDGQSIAHHFTNDKVAFDTPLEHIGARAGLYNVVVHSHTTVDGVDVKRSIRLPFVHQLESASIDAFALTEQTSKYVDAEVSVNVLQKGRYGVVATLMGYRDDKQIALATSEAAQDFSTSDTLPIRFTLPNGAKGPYQVNILELKDQTRLQRFVQKDLETR